MVGTIPNQLTTLPFLVSLSISSNAFNGTVPSFDGTTTTSIDYSANCFSNCTVYPSRAPSCPCTVQPLIAADKQALVDLYSSTNGSAWTGVSGWSNQSSDPCIDGWTGVTCNGYLPSRVQYVSYRCHRGPCRDGLTR